MDKPGEFNTDIIQHATISEGVLRGTIHFSATRRSVNVQLDTEADKSELGDFETVIEALGNFARYFEIDRYDKLREDISKEITDSAYEQDDYAPTAEDYKSLEDDLQLIEISVFPDGFLLEYQAEKIFPGNSITVQLTQDYEIDDIAVNG